LWNVIQCVVRNAKSVILTAVFAVIIIYLFAICGYLFIQDDFLMQVKPLEIEDQTLNLTLNNKTDLLGKYDEKLPFKAYACFSYTNLSLKFTKNIDYLNPYFSSYSM
jgi:hypothetical protein